MEILIIVIIVLIVMMLMSARGQKKQREHMQQMQNEMVPGVWVRTASGFYGIISDFDGDVAILQTPSGEESYWDRRALTMVVDNPPFAPDDELEDDLQTPADNDETAEVAEPEKPAEQNEPAEKTEPEKSEEPQAAPSEKKDSNDEAEKEDVVEEDPDDLWDDSFAPKKSDGESRA